MGLCLCEHVEVRSNDFICYLCLTDSFGKMKITDLTIKVRLFSRVLPTPAPPLLQIPRGFKSQRFSNTDIIKVALGGIYL